MKDSLHLPYSIKGLSKDSNIWKEMMFDIPFIADWKKIGDYRQRQTDLNKG
jgi:hypothetical protein